MKSKIEKKGNGFYVFATFIRRTKVKEIFLSRIKNFKFGGKITVIDEDEIKELDKALNYSTAQVLPNNDVVLMGFDEDGQSLVVVPATEEFDLRFHGLKGKVF